MNTEFPTYFSSKHALSMELRDYFAAKAMEGLIASTQDEQYFFDSIANMAYLMADTMLERRNKK